jgi:hypothetical protein
MIPVADSSAVNYYEKRIEELTKQVSTLQKRAEVSEVECERAKDVQERVEEESNLVRFKNQLLIEMVSEALVLTVS